MVSGIVTSVDVKTAFLEMAENVEGVIKGSELSTDAVEDVRQRLKEGDTLEALIVGFDRKRRIVNLSVRAKENEEEAAALEEYGSDGPSVRTTLGDLLKEQMDSKD